MRNPFAPSFWKINQQVAFRRVALLACLLLSSRVKGTSRYLTQPGIISQTEMYQRYKQ